MTTKTKTVEAPNAADADERRLWREAAERDAAERTAVLRQKAEATAAAVDEAKTALDALGPSPEQLYRDHQQAAFWELRQRNNEDAAARTALDRHLRETQTAELKQLSHDLAREERAAYDHGNTIMGRGRWDRDEMEHNDQRKQQLRYVMHQIRLAFRLTADEQRALVKRFRSEFAI